MNFLDTIFGRNLTPRDASKPADRALTEDERAIEQYEHVMRTAPPETAERIHEQAFAKLTPEQRELMFETFVERAETPGQRPADATPAALAATATKTERQQPGALARLFGATRGKRDQENDPSSSLFATFVAYSLASDLAFAFFISTSIAGSYPDDTADQNGGDSSGGEFTTDFGGGDIGF